MIEYLITF